MKKILLALFILVDLSIMVAAGVFLYARLSQHPMDLSFGQKASRPSPVLPAPTRVIANSIPDSGGALIKASTAPVNSLALQNPVATTASSAVRHIAFTYRNSHARKVDIKADFTQWHSEAMLNKGGTWTYQATLPPGEYEYCFIVDDNKGIRDPTNKRQKQIGTTYVSAIVVSALPAKPK